jgi:hypothetical protein
MSLIQLAFLGALIGLPFGYALQRTKLCFNIAYLEVILHRRTVLLRLIGLAVLIQMIGLALLIQFNVGGVSLESGEPATLPNAMGVNTWLVIIPLAALLDWWLL